MKKYLHLLISKVGVLDTETFSSVTGNAVIPEGTLTKENRISAYAPFSGYVTAIIRCKASVVNLMVNHSTLTQVITSNMEETLFQTVHAPCAKGDFVEVAILAKSEGIMELKFFAINNGK